MSPSARALGLVVLAGLLFYLLFHGQVNGINYLVWCLGLVVLAHGAHPHLRRTALGRAATALVVFTCGVYFWLDTNLAFSASQGALWLLAGACYTPAPRSVWAATLGGLHTQWLQIWVWTYHALLETVPWVRRSPVLRHLHPAYALPVVAVVPLGLLLMGASPVFADRVGTGLLGLLRAIDSVLSLEVWVPLVLLTGVGGFLAAPLLICRRPLGFLQWEQQALRQLPAPTQPPTDRQQWVYRLGVVGLVLVNLLLLAFNAADVHWIWFDFYLPPGVPLSQLVHEGTYYLIASILLSMGALLYLFGRRPHATPEARRLRLLALLWLAQNLVLVVSVAVRTLRYIDTHGLAYKRIGVLFFLALTVVGLVTLAVKLRHNLSLSYLLRWNSLAALVLWVGAGCVDWDGVILRHNLRYLQPGTQDAYFHLRLSEHHLATVIRNRYRLRTEDPAFERAVRTKAEQFLAQNHPSRRNWLSWSPRRAQTYRNIQSAIDEMPITEP